MVYKVLNREECTCYVCLITKNDKVFQNEIKKVIEIIGFLPEIFVQGSRYENYYFNIDYEFTDLIKMMGKKKEVLNTLLQDNEPVRKTIKTPKHKQTYCFICGALHRKNGKNSIEVDGKTKNICLSCIKKFFFFCKECGKLEDISLGRSLDRTTRVCSSCINLFQKCFSCGTFRRKTELVLKIIRRPNTDSYEMINAPLCPLCTRSVGKCPLCETEYLVKSSQMNKCPSCYKLTSVPIHPWSFKPSPLFRKTNTEKKRKDTLFFGIEWEIENHTTLSNEKHIQELHSFFPPTFFYCKTDSSIHRGFEIVTQPFTWGSWLEDRDNWSKILTYCAENKLAASSPHFGKGWSKTCGIHIHTSKDAYTTAHLYKFLKFMYEKENREFILHISSRPIIPETGNKENEYFSFRKTDINKVAYCAKTKELASGERHSAINLMLPTTVENRIFNSTIDIQEFFKNMEFSHAAFYFSRDTSMKGVSWEDFLIYISKKPKTYSNLCMYIKSKIGGVYGTFLSNSTTK